MNFYRKIKRRNTFHDWSHEIKRCLLLGRKPMANLDRVLKSRGITLPTKVHIVKTMVFPVVMMWDSHKDVRVGQQKRLSTEELMLLNCGVGEDSWESLGLQGDPTSPSWRKSTLNIHWLDWCWNWSSNNLATLYEEPTHQKRLWS